METIGLSTRGPDAVQVTLGSGGSGTTSHKCPICDGHGTVPGGFYLATGGAQSLSSNRAAEPCRACGGTGIVWS